MYISDMSNLSLITTKEFASIARLSTSHVARLVRDGRVVPAMTLPNGHHLFTEEQAQEMLRLRTERKQLSQQTVQAPTLAIAADVENQLNFGAVAA